jgi:hypothetical protein
MPVGDVYEVRLVTHTATQVGLNVRHYRVSLSTPPEPSPDAIAADIDGAMAPLYKPALSVQANYRGVGARKIRPLPPGPEGISIANAGPGTSPGSMLPPQTAGVISLRAIIGGRANRSRIYVPFPSEDENVDNGLPAASYLITLNSIGGAWLGNRVVTVGLGSITLVPVVFHRVPGTTTDLAFETERPVWGTQRRRGGFGATNPVPF